MDIDFEVSKDSANPKEKIKRELFRLEDIVGPDIQINYCNTPINSRKTQHLDTSVISYTAAVTEYFPSLIGLGIISVKFMFNTLKKLKDDSVIKDFSVTEISSKTSNLYPSSLCIRITTNEGHKPFYIGTEFIIRNPSKDALASADNNLYMCSLMLAFLPTDIKIVNFIANKLLEGPRISLCEETPTVEIIAINQNGLHLRRVDITSNSMSDEELSLHYGEDFVEFNNVLISEMSEKTKGIVLLHGSPGHGKTYYIRHLVSMLRKSEKRLIIVPKHVLAEMESPSFNSFMINEFSSAENSNAIFIIEDAESVLRARDSGGDGRAVVSTILNLSDGLLNDVYKIQLICTFNSGLENIDKALLRSGRLLARKEFCSLDVESANKLAAHLGVTNVISGDMSLADIYALREGEREKAEILTKVVPKITESKRRPAGFFSKKLN